MSDVPMVPVALGLGSSFGDSPRILCLAVYALAVVPGLRLQRCSRIISSAPAGGIASGTFLNAVLRGRTSLSPLELLDHCKEIEVRLGRVRTRRWADRVLDIDVLLWGDAPWNHPRLRIPHPRLVARDFLLQPLAEVWPEARNPWSGLPFRETLPLRTHYPVVGVLPQPRIGVEKERSPL